MASLLCICSVLFLFTLETQLVQCSANKEKHITWLSLTTLYTVDGVVHCLKFNFTVKQTSAVSFCIKQILPSAHTFRSRWTMKVNLLVRMRTYVSFSRNRRPNPRVTFTLRLRYWIWLRTGKAFLLWTLVSFTICWWWFDWRVVSTITNFGSRCALYASCQYQ
jgi:hypothetical protein